MFTRNITKLVFEVCLVFVSVQNYFMSGMYLEKSNTLTVKISIGQTMFVIHFMTNQNYLVKLFSWYPKVEQADEIMQCGDVRLG